MKKLVSSLFALVVLSSAAFAQFQLGANASYATVTGDAGDFLSGGFGFGLIARYEISEKIRVGVDFGTTTFNGETVDGFEVEDLDVLNFTGVFEYTFGGEAFKPYGVAKLGLISFDGVDENGEEEAQSEFGFGIGAGFRYAFSDALDLDVNVTYNSYSAEPENLTFIPVSVGLVYKFGN